MEPILPPSTPPAASAAPVPKGSAEHGERACSPDPADSCERQFESILKRAVARQKGLSKGRPPEQGGHRAKTAGKDSTEEGSAPPSVSAATWGSVAPAAPDDSRPGAGAVASDPKGAVSAKSDPVGVLAGAAAPPAEGDPLLEFPSTGTAPAASSDPKGAVSAKSDPVAVLAGAAAPPAEGDPLLEFPSTGTAPAASSDPKGAVSAKSDPVAVLAGAAAPPAEGDPLLEFPSTGTALAASSDPKGAVSAKSDPVAVLAGAAAPPAEGDPLLEFPSTGTAPAASSDPKGAVSAKSDPVAVLAGAAAPPAEGDPLLKYPSTGTAPAASGTEPKSTGTAKVDGTPLMSGNTDPSPEGAREAEGTRKYKGDASARNEGQPEPVPTLPAGGNRGVAERIAPPRSVVPASDPAVVRFEEKTFVITRKSDTSVEVTLAPPGVGKLEIEVVLEKGVVNARITAADPAGREAIARNLPQIVEALARDGMNIGGFTVSLKEKRGQGGDVPVRDASRNPDARLLSAVPPAASASGASAGLVNIFV